MNAQGTFDIELQPQEDAGFPAGRLLISKTYQGGLAGSGTGQMISKRIESGPAVYSAIEEFAGTLADRTGSFTLVHRGYMTQDTQSLEIIILEGSGGGELKGITGSMQIEQDEQGHRYTLEYEL